VHSSPAAVETVVWDLVLWLHGDAVIGLSGNLSAWWHRTSLGGQDKFLRRNKGDSPGAPKCNDRVGPTGIRQTSACNGARVIMLSKQEEVLSDLSASVVLLFLYRFFGLALNLVFFFIKALNINSTARLGTLAILVLQQWHVLSHDIARFHVRLVQAHEPS